MNLTAIPQDCPCGKRHVSSLKDVEIGKNAILKLPEALKKLGSKKFFLLADINTNAAVGERVKKLLSAVGIDYAEHIFKEQQTEPDERSVGAACMHYSASCDTVIAIGSGVINDIGKILASMADTPYIIVATAPSMDGYASATSSMVLDGLKVSLNTKCADVIIGDTEILKAAPMHMLKSGLGDMLAKYISICEWRLSHLITGEYYCESVAGLVRTALEKCVKNAVGLLSRSDEAVEAVFEGLIICGVAMAYAGISRPASGTEHYFSHLWDMRGVEFHTPTDLHGIQCANGTLLTLKLYDVLKTITPDKEKALAYVNAFDLEDWHKKLRSFLGNGAEAMIRLEKTEGKYDPAKHHERLDIILENWDAILNIITEELPEVSEIEQLLKTLDIPPINCNPEADASFLATTFKATKDLRDKYILARLAWDLGVLDELAEVL